MAAIPSIPQTDKCRIVAHRLSGPRTPRAFLMARISSVSLNHVGRLLKALGGGRTQQQTDTEKET